MNRFTGKEHKVMNPKQQAYDLFAKASATLSGDALSRYLMDQIFYEEKKGDKETALELSYLLSDREPEGHETWSNDCYYRDVTRLQTEEALGTISWMVSEMYADGRAYLVGETTDGDHAIVVVEILNFSEVHEDFRNDPRPWTAQYRVYDEDAIMDACEYADVDSYADRQEACVKHYEDHGPNSGTCWRTWETFDELHQACDFGDATSYVRYAGE